MAAPFLILKKYFRFPSHFAHQQVFLEVEEELHQMEMRKRIKSKKKTVINRSLIEGHKNLMADYFNPDARYTNQM